MLQIRDKLTDARLQYEERECDCQYSNLKNVEPEARKNVVVELMALAKPAKVKGMASPAVELRGFLNISEGVAKEFEIVKKIKDVIALEDSISDLELGDDDWEEIDYDQDVREKRTYSAALRGR